MPAVVVACWLLLPVPRVLLVIKKRIDTGEKCC